MKRVKVVVDVNRATWGFDAGWEGELDDERADEMLATGEAVPLKAPAKPASAPARRAK